MREYAWPDYPIWTKEDELLADQDRENTIRGAIENNDGELPETVTFNGREIPLQDAMEYVQPPGWERLLQMVTGTLDAEVTSSTTAEVTWDINFPAYHGIYLYRNGTQIADLSPGTTSYSDTGLEKGEQYCYRIAIYVIVGEVTDGPGDTEGERARSPKSTPACVVMPCVDDLAATSTGTTAIDLTWTDTASGNTGYYVIRDGAIIDDISGTAATYTDDDTELVAGQEYCYQLQAYWSDRHAFSNIACEYTDDAYTQPTDFVVDPSSGTEITGTWTDNAVGNDGYHVVNVTDGTDAHVVTPGLESHTWTGLTTGKQYCFKVAPFTDDGTSYTYGTYTETKCAYPYIETALACDRVHVDSIVVSWAGTNIANADSIEVWKRPTGGEWTKDDTITGDNTTYVYDELETETEYTFTLMVYDDTDTFRGYSNGTTCATVPSDPVPEGATDGDILYWRDGSWSLGEVLQATEHEVDLIPEIRVDANNNIQVRMRRVVLNLSIDGKLSVQRGEEDGTWRGIPGNECP